MNKKWNINYEDQETMVSLQQLMAARQEQKSINTELLDAEKKAIASNYMSPDYLANKAPLNVETVTSLMEVLNALGLTQQDFESFHNKRVPSQNHSNQITTQNDATLKQTNSFTGCDFSSAKIISGNQNVNVTFEK